MKTKAVKRSKEQKRWATAKKADVIEWFAEAIMLRDLEQASQLILYSPRFKKQEKSLLGKIADSAKLTLENKYMGYEGR